jgi:DnaJ like chaperone protein
LSWWGKLIGGTVGFMLGGPLGAILGASFGHNWDQAKSFGGGSSFGYDHVDVERIQMAFFTATFSMMGHLAKADGHVTRDEIALAESVMRQMNLDAQQKKLAIRLFDKGKQAGFPADDVLEQFRQECHRRRNLLQMFLEILTATALADGAIHPSERRILQHASGTLGFSTAEFNMILQRMQAGQHMHQRPENSASALNDAYKLLGVDKQASDQDIKKAYRRLMNQHHPDKLVAKGLPQEMMDMANQKTMEIKAAYELIKKSRGA